MQNAQGDWEHWKVENVPLMYDWLAHRNLEWPSSSARWGAILKRYGDKVVQRLFYCERTGDTEFLNTLVLAKAHIPYGGLSDRQSLGRFSNQGGNSGKLQTEKRILHPGEINALRLCHQREGLICTHSDTSIVYVWDTDAAPHASQNKRRKVGDGAKACAPTVTLVGHEKMAQYAIDTSRHAPLVASGGQDHLVLLWSLDDVSSAQQWSPGGETRTGPVLYPRHKFCGHTDTVEAVACHPTNVDELCSGGDDKLLLFWDCRQEGHKPASIVKDLHFNDINCLGWNPVATEMVATGDSDGVIRVFDMRSLAKPVHTIPAGSSEGYGWMAGGVGAGHVGSVMTVEWMPHASTILASGGDDCPLRIWDLSQAGSSGDGAEEELEPVFVHAGHRHTVVDIDWNEHSPGTLVTLSEPTDGGSKLQMWRVSETIADGWPLQEGTTVGSIDTDGMEETVDRLNPPMVAFPMKRPHGGLAKVKAPAVSAPGTKVGDGPSGRPAARRRTDGSTSPTDGAAAANQSLHPGGGRGAGTGLTVVGAVISAMQDADPENEGMALGAIIAVVERNHPGLWQAKSVHNMISSAARKATRLVRGEGRGANMLIKRVAGAVPGDGRTARHAAPAAAGVEEVKAKEVNGTAKDENAKEGKAKGGEAAPRPPPGNPPPNSGGGLPTTGA